MLCLVCVVYIIAAAAVYQSMFWSFDLYHHITCLVYSCLLVVVSDGVSYTLFGNYQVPPKTHNVNRGRLVLTGFPQCCHMNSSCQRVPITTQCGNYQVPPKTSSSHKIQFPPIGPHIKIPPNKFDTQFPPHPSSSNFVFR
uniref:Uncharacterized protein n=1 Tax=Cacopsylla melanoneura TaxID=428564 RepID=A0A8D9E1I8_9HEMI